MAFKEHYPAVYNHLLQYKSELSSRNKAETGIRYEWYALQRWGANYWEDFFKPKIIFQEIVKGSQFYYDIDKYYTNDTCRIIVGSHLGFLLGILNSDLFFFAVKTFYGGGVLGEHGVRMKHTFFEKFPCIEYNSIIEQYALDLQNNFSLSLYNEINKAIYESYHLNDKEIAYIANCKF